MYIDEEGITGDMTSLISAEGDKREENESLVMSSGDLGSPSVNYGFSNIRVRCPLKLTLPNITRHEEWGSNDTVDIQHWAKFREFSPFAKRAKEGNFHIPNLAQQENIFMRWKEHFFVSDHCVRPIGVSFEGFTTSASTNVKGPSGAYTSRGRVKNFRDWNYSMWKIGGALAQLSFVNEGML
ncbi:hypothetical protein BKA61DRAFT_661534 [Leptodontidium sp. MPI-SDFR-AT-0119]|nr:hypothetical protein BKA61DRAFT_661534 [Leptodontidium sp. MPI-SDFR-AT-0119]